MYDTYLHDEDVGELGYLSYVLDCISDALELEGTLSTLEGLNAIVYVGELGTSLLGSDLIELHETASEEDVWENVELDELVRLEQWLYERWM